MPVLDKPKWELFAKEVARGNTQRASYKAIGGKAKNPDSAASDLANNPKVKARIKELQRRVTDKAIERAALTKTWVMEKLRDNAEKALEVPEGSAVANRALELIGKELGMFRDDQPQKPLTLKDLSDDDLRKLLESGSEQHADMSATEPGTVQ